MKIKDQIKEQIDERFVAWAVGVIVGMINVNAYNLCPWWAWIITCLVLGAVSRPIIESIYAKIERLKTDQTD